jgi:Family of unknown function (DUF6175)
MFKRVFIIFTALFFTAISAQAQSASSTKPRIIVIPLTKKGEDPRAVYEGNTGQRVATAKIQEAMLNKGAYIIDFLATVKAAETEQLFNSGAESDIKTMILDYSGADIFVEIDLIPTKKGAYGTSMTMIFKCYDAFTQELMGSTTMDGEPTQTSDTTLMVNAGLKRADNKITEFLNLINAKFGEVRENGRNIKVVVVLETQDYDFDAQVTPGGETLGTILENWMAEEKNALSYDDVRIVAKKMNFPGVRIPMVNDKGRKLKPSMFATSFTNYCKTLALADNPGTKLRATSSAVGGFITITFK